MRRISSRNTFFSKRVFPVIWFGFIAFFVGLVVLKAPKGGMPPMTLVGPLLMAASGYLIMKKFVFDLADEVQDAGDALIVRFGSERQRIPLSEIMNVSYAYMQNPPRVTLTLRTPCQFGKQVSFSPPTPLLPFAKSPIVDDLIERVDAARRTS